MYQVIIADDEPWVIYRLQNLIDWNAFGYKIAGTASDGLSALELVKKCRPALLFSDILMPGLDGLELAKKIKTVSPDTVMILITGYSEFNYALEALRQGVFDYLVKPIRRADLSGVLKRVQKELEKAAPDSENATSESSVIAPPTQFQKILDYIDDNYMHELRLTDVAQQFFLSSAYLSTLIKKETGNTFSELVIRKRIAAAKMLLSETDLSVQEVMERVGYRDCSCFIRLFKKHTGVTPTAWRKDLSRKKDSRLKL